MPETAFAVSSRAVTTLGADLISAVAAESSEELAAGMKEDRRQITMAQARLVLRQAEFGRRQAYLDEGATSLESWSAENLGVSAATARSYSHVAEKTRDIPRIMGSFCAGEISFDKVRAVIDVATAENDQHLYEQAKERSVRELAELARTTAARARSAWVSTSRAEHDNRYLRFNDERRTMSLQLPKESYAQTKACVDAFAAGVSSEEEMPLDQRRCDGFMGIVDLATHGAAREATTPNPFFVVAHVPLEDLVDGAGERSELAAELEHDGLIDVETVQRIACDATVVVAVDDHVGHTMYEGRARRFPSGAQRREVIRRDRHCRFPGCTNATFAAVHHVVPWKAGGRTDLDNLVLLCRHHHGVVHRKGWSMEGSANGELRIENPSGRVTVSRPSPLWTRASASSRAADSG